MRILSAAWLLLLCAGFGAIAQDESYRVYTGHPRLFLSPRHLRLLKRERERASMRWTQFEKIIKNSGAIPEPGFSQSLYFVTSGDTAAAQKAIDWGLGPGSDLVQLALVYDWCNDALSESQSSQLRDKIARKLEDVRGSDVFSERDRVLGAIATADDSAHMEEPVLRDVVDRWFDKQLAPQLETGKTTLSAAEAYALVQIFHAVHDNLNIDLRDAAPQYFRSLPILMVASNYPASLKGPENEYRIPVHKAAEQLSITTAALGRAAGLSLVAFDGNSTEAQFLQGWLIQDRYILRSPFGAPYEFLWANPYEPGLSYFHLPLDYYDPHSGALFLRSSWDDDATWFGIFRGEEQLFSSGKLTVLNHEPGLLSAPFEVGDATVVVAHGGVEFTAQTKAAFVVGLIPGRQYTVEIERGENRQGTADPAGTLSVQLPGDRKTKVRISGRS